MPRENTTERAIVKQNLSQVRKNLVKCSNSKSYQDIGECLSIGVELLRASIWVFWLRSGRILVIRICGILHQLEKREDR